MRKHFAVALATLALAACGPADDSTTPASTGTTEAVIAPCQDVDAPPPAKAENNVQTLVPTTYCDSALSVTEDGQVECAESVKSFEITVDATVKGFNGEDVATRHYPNNDGVNGFTRINWGGPMKAHVIIVNGIRWAFVDSPSASSPASSNLVASLLNNSDWGGGVTADSRVEACGQMNM